jgi:hypothetical protein
MVNFPAAAADTAAGPAVDLDFSPRRFPFRKVRTRMYVRLCWAFFIHVLQAAYGELDPADPNQEPTRRTQHWVVSGTPGIGTYTLHHWGHCSLVHDSAVIIIAN